MADHNEENPRFALPALLPLAKKAAHNALNHRLLEVGLDESAALAVSRAIVDPADARRRLDRLVPVRVPGGTFEALDTTVWGPAASAFVVNNRAASSRRFPVAGLDTSESPTGFRPLRPATSPPEDEDARLLLSANSPEHLVWGAEQSVQYLLSANPLAGSIGAQGVMVAITAAVVTCNFADGSAPVTMVGAVDGSSRVTGVHETLGLTPREVLFNLPADDRLFRGQIADWLAVQDRSVDVVTDEQVAQLRALQVPARILLRFVPDDVAPVNFAKAVESLVHLVHVEPPKEWDEAASLDAKADSVLAALRAKHIITPGRKQYFDGMLTPAEAAEHGFAPAADQRAIDILAVISSESTKTKAAVRAAVLELSHAQKLVRKEEKARIAVELALRAVRADWPAALVKSARLALQNAYQLDGLWNNGVRPVVDEDPEELRDLALEELNAGVVGPARMRLAGQGAFWLAVHRVLREPHFFASRDVRDGRSPQKVLEALSSSEHGIQVLYRALVDGRDRQHPVQVDEHGARLRNVQNNLIDMSSDWLRGTVVPTVPTKTNDTTDDATLPTRLLLERTKRLAGAVQTAEDLHANLRDVKDATGRPLIDTVGMNAERAEEMRATLEKLRTHLAVYAMKWTERNDAEVEDLADPVDEDLAADDDLQDEISREIAR